MPERISLSDVVPYGISDHYLTFISLKKNIEKKAKVSFRCRNPSGYSSNLLQIHLNGTNWNYYYNTRSPSTCWDFLYFTYLKTLDEIAPFTYILNVKDTEDWVSPELLSLIRQRDKLKEEVDSFTDKATNVYEEKCKKFREKRNQVKRAVIKAKRNYVSAKLHSNIDNPRKYWAELNRVMPSGKNKSRIEKDTIVLKNELGNLIEADKTAAYINKFFTEIGPSLSDNITLDNNNYLESLERSVSDKTLEYWKEVDVDEVRDMVKDTDVYKCSNINDISTALLKDINFPT